MAGKPVLSTVKRWLCLDLMADGRLPWRWPESNRLIAQSVIDYAVELGWVVTDCRVDACYLTDTGRAIRQAGDRQ